MVSLVDVVRVLAELRGREFDGKFRRWGTRYIKSLVTDLTSVLTESERTLVLKSLEVE